MSDPDQKARRAPAPGSPGASGDLQPLTRLGLQCLVGARRAHQRCLLVLSGSRAWAVAAVDAVLSTARLERRLWVGGSPPEDIQGITPAKAKGWLGREVDVLVFDAHGGFDPDAFGAVTGALRGGGLMLFLVPHLERWPGLADPEHARLAVHPWTAEQLQTRFVRRLAGVIRSSPDVVLVREGYPLPRGEPEPAAPPAGHPGPVEPGPWRTEDQRRAVRAVERVARGHRRRPLVLTSDRGRGKSSAFGIAAARLMEPGPLHIVLTGARRESSRPVLEHAAALLPGCEAEPGRVRHGASILEYRAPDALVRDPPDADLVLVDEAAALPVPVLERLLARYARIAFATTVHGYEGSGRGFALRFRRILDRHTPAWRAQRLEQPIRWAPGDPLERFVLRALLLDAEPPPPAPNTPVQPAEPVLEAVDRDALGADDARLSHLFGLLVLAHYRTRPFDLRRLLDAPDLSVYLLRESGRLVAAALVVREGDLPGEIRGRIWAGRRRLRGHLMPQSLAAHLGLEEALGLQGGRIMRIAVHPECQGRGLGTEMVRGLTARAADAGLDWIGVSFGATPGLLAFWRRAGMRTVRTGFTREAASGSHSVLMLRGLSAEGRALAGTARCLFLERLPQELSGPLRDLAPEEAAALLRRDAEEAVPTEPPSAHQWRELAAFAFAQRPYEDVHAAAWRAACLAVGDPAGPLDPGSAETALIVQRVVSKRSSRETARSQDLSGRAETADALRRAYRPLIEHYAAASVCAVEKALEDPGAGGDAGID